MDAEIKAKWLAALRSGDYKQGIGALKTWDGRYCCLGVLCDVVDPAGWSGGNRNHRGCFGYPGGDVVSGAQIRMGGCDRLAKMNDDGATFSKIADWIERNL